MTYAVYDYGIVYSWRSESDVSGCGECIFFCQAEDGIRDLVRSRGLGDVYKRQAQGAGISAQR